MSKFVEVSEDAWFNLDHLTVASENESGETTIAFVNTGTLDVPVPFNVFVAKHLRSGKPKPTVKKKPATAKKPVAKPAPKKKVVTKKK